MRHYFFSRVFISACSFQLCIESRWCTPFSTWKPCHVKSFFFFFFLILQVLPPTLSGTCSSVSQLKWPAPLPLFVPLDLWCLARTHKCRLLSLPSYQIFVSTSELCTACSDYCPNVAYADLLIRFNFAVYIALLKAQLVVALCVPSKSHCGLLYQIRAVSDFCMDLLYWRSNKAQMLNCPCEQWKVLKSHSDTEACVATNTNTLILRYPKLKLNLSHRVPFFFFKFSGHKY